MKRKLHYRYVQQKRTLIISSILTILYFTLLGVPFDKKPIYSNVYLNLIKWGYKRLGNVTIEPWLFVFSVVMDILLNIYLVFFTLFNTQNVEFKIYLKDLLYGRKIIGGEFNTAQ